MGMRGLFRRRQLKRPRSTKITVYPTPAQLKAADENMSSYTRQRTRPSRRTVQQEIAAITAEETDSMTTLRRSIHQMRHQLSVDLREVEAEQELKEHKERLSKITTEEFLNCFRENGSECLCHAYLLLHPVDESQFSGVLSTSLPQDVFALLEAQICLLDEYLVSTGLFQTDAGDVVLMDAIHSMLRNLWYKQSHFRNTFLVDLESCIASANDFLRMAEKIEDMMQGIAARHSHLDWNGAYDDGDTDVQPIERKRKDSSITSILQKEAAEVVALFGADAIYAAQQSVSFIIQAVQESDISDELFSRDWEDKLTHNEVAVSIVRTFEEFLSDVCNYIEQDFLYHKVIAALVRATVCFYMECFVRKADQMRLAKKRDFGRMVAAVGKKCKPAKPEEIAFNNAARAIFRMNYDIDVLRDYFTSAAKGETALTKTVEVELAVLTEILECMWLAVGQTNVDSLEEFVILVHKRTGADPEVTKEFFSDLWLLMGPTNEYLAVEKRVQIMDPKLRQVSSKLLEAKGERYDTALVSPGLDDTLKSLYEERNLQRQTSITCGNIFRDVREIHEEARMLRLQ